MKHEKTRYAIVFLLFIIFFLSSCSVIGQISVPQWVDDIGSATGSSISSGVIADKQNNIYISGVFDGTVDFDPSAAVKNLTSDGGLDVYIAKYTSAGTLIWAVRVGGTVLDQVNGGISLDNNGNVSITGFYQSTSFDADPGPGSFNLSGNGGSEWFILRLNTDGNFLWAKSIASNGTDYGHKVSVDNSGDVIAVGQLGGNVLLGNTTITSGSRNGLIAKYNSAGNLAWAINLSGGEVEVHGVVTDGQDNIIVSGYFSGTVNFNPLGTSNTLNTGNSEFIAKYTKAGILLWVMPVTGSFENNYSYLCVDSKDEIYLYAPFSSQIRFQPNLPFNPSGSQDVFIAKYAASGGFLWSKDIGGTNASIYSYGISISKDDYIYCTGYFSGTIDFNPSPTATAPVSYHGVRDLFLAKYDIDGNYTWAFSVGNGNCDNTLSRHVAIDYNNDVLLTGSFCSTISFNACSTLSLTAKSSFRDTFLAKYVQSTANAGQQITSFSVPQEIEPASIDHANLRITLKLIAGTNITALVPSITYSNGTVLAPPSGVAQNFSNPVVYSLKSGCNLLNYTVVTSFLIPTTVTTCSGSVSSLTGDVLANGSTGYTWEQLVNGTWSPAPGTNSVKDYVTASLTTTAIFRRKINIAQVSGYDSYFNVVVNPLLMNNVLTQPAVSVFCSGGDPANISGSTPGGGNGSISYQWESSPDNITFTSISGIVSKDFDPPAISSTIYYRRMVTSGGCSLYSNAVSFTAGNNLPGPVISPSDVTICMGSAASFSVVAPQQGVLYNWYTSPAKTTLLFTGLNYSSAPLTANTTFYVEALGTCNSSLSSVIATISPFPLLPQASDKVVCPGSTATLTATSSDINDSVKWYLNATGGQPIFTGRTFITPILNSNITYYVEAVNNTGCPSVARTRVNVLLATQISKPVVTVSAITASSITFQWPLVNGALSYQVSLDNGQTFSTPGAGISGSTYTTANLQPGQHITLIVRAIGSTSCEVSNSDAVTAVTISPVFIPNVFTPNADGSNDILYVYSESITDVRFSIYDQWGKMLFSSNNKASGWDGTYKNTEEPAGVYVYLLEAIGPDGGRIVKKGSVTLVR